VTCLPCSVAQMARHTANYHTYEAVCCSKTGLPDGIKVEKDLSSSLTTTGHNGSFGDGLPTNFGTKDGGYAV
jgi:hypothetical protein